MSTKLLIVQRFYYNFREGFFDYLSDNNYDFKLINATTSLGRVTVHNEAKDKSFIKKVTSFFIGQNYVIFPFLFFNIIRTNPKVIVTDGGQNTINNFQVLLYCKMFKRQFIIWDLGKGYADFGNSLLRKTYMRFYKYLLSQSTYVYGYNSQSKLYFESLGVQKEKIIILNNTIDTRKIKKICAISDFSVPIELRQQYERNCTFFIFVGTLLRSKNIESLSDLIRLLGDRYCLIIVGDGDEQYKNELKKIFDNTNTIFVGYKKLEQLKSYYKVSSFSILPGLGGLSINQSMAFGVPVICSGADGAEQDLVIKNETGYIYKDINEANLYIQSKNNEDWLRMGKISESFLFSNHSVESMMNRFIYYIDNL